MSPAQQRAMILGAEIAALLTVRDRRVHLMRASADWLASSPAWQAAYLMEVALIDQRRRQLRALLADELEATDAAA